MGTCGLAAGAEEALNAIQTELDKRHLTAAIGRVGCVGMCAYEPMIDLQAKGRPRFSYGQATAENVSDIFSAYLDGEQLQRAVLVGQVVPASMKSNGSCLSSLSFVDPASQENIAFHQKQRRIVLSNCGLIDPESIDDYLAVEGYQALVKALTGMTPESVIEEVTRSGLRGRGGGGFPAGLKWSLARKTQRWPKYVICNADEGDPGAFMDRSVLEGDPHSVVEGMTIAAYAIGASHGIIYCRAEYPLAIRRLEIALEQARELGLLGEDILGSGFSFDLSVKEGAGAFVCGEETALMASIQGERGQPWPRPPYPAVAGLWGQPSNVNNVKSYAYTPRVIRLGADWFKSLGTEGSPGTAVFALTGMVNRTGLVEVPMGITLGGIIYEVGGGIAGGRKFKAVQTGGPLGGCLPESYLDTPVDFDSLRAAGATMGSGGMIVADETTCMVEFAKYFMQFVCDESCGKCPPCRIGSTRMLEILERITSGKGEPSDVDRIRHLATGMQRGSLCALGQLAPSPILSALRHFEEEFWAHIKEGRCPAAGCRMLVRASCVSACPAGVDAPAYLALVAQGRYAEALAVHREANPFPMICGRVCPAFCERRCRRGQIDEPVSIRQVKRFMADRYYSEPWTPPKLARAKGIKVAIIGAGPCGLTAALRLAQRGYSVTVFERMPLPGGMMTYGIPAYRLPREPLFAEIDHIRRAGVEIRCEQELGTDFTIKSLKNDGYRAIILALGAHRSRKLGAQGEDKNGVYHGVQMLRDIALGRLPDLKGKIVVVVGGGDTAMDAARSSWRLGAEEVHLVYRRERHEMPANAEEIEAAMEEGVEFHFLVTPVVVLGHDRVSGVRLQRQQLGEFDASGRRRPVPIPGSEFDMPCDLLVPAIGQVTWIDDEAFSFNRKATFDVGKAFETQVEGVFAAGDSVLGPGTVVQSVAHGNQVALTVDAWLTTGQLGGVHYQPKRHDVAQLFNLDEYAGARRPKAGTISPEERRRRGDFAEAEQVLEERAAQEECKRCLRCDLEWLERIGEPLP
ncbi:MAG: FAD-dependent oxidoreductase [Acidobacteria bacterium]|nr:MAG: FAD-dependent oxidoreductase [Acidobacteriota bacterium]